jgi:hypothetical protein
MAVTTSTVAAILKRLYPQREVLNLVYQDNPLLAMMPKAGDFDGAALAIAVRYGDTMGRSADFATAQAQVGNFRAEQFLLTRVKDYQLYSLETEAILAARNDRGALVRSLDTEVSSALNNIGRSQARQLYDDGSGKIGRLAASGGVSGTTFTLSDANDIVNFEKGQKIVVCPTDVTTDLRNSGAGMTIQTVDRDAGSFTVDSNTDSAANSDFVFIKGDRPATGALATAYLRMAGLEAWNPASAPGSTLFFNVNRTSDVTRLGGMRIDVSSKNPEEGLIFAVNRMAREGARPSHYFLNFADAINIQLALGSKVITEYQTVGDVGFSTLRVMGPKGDVRVVPDQNAPAGVGRMLTLSTWKIHYLGDFPNILDMDGARLSRVYNADQFEGRMTIYGQLGCEAPGFNARLVLPT